MLLPFCSAYVQVFKCLLRFAVQPDMCCSTELLQILFIKFKLSFTEKENMDK